MADAQPVRELIGLGIDGQIHGLVERVTDEELTRWGLNTNEPPQLARLQTITELCIVQLP